MVVEKKSKPYRSSANVAEDRTRVATDSAALVISSIATALVLIVFTVPLTTLTGTASALAAGPAAQAWILSAMSVGAAAGLLVRGVNNTARYLGSATGLTVCAGCIFNPRAFRTH